MRRVWEHVHRCAIPHIVPRTLTPVPALQSQQVARLRGGVATDVDDAFGSDGAKNFYERLVHSGASRVRDDNIRLGNISAPFTADAGETTL